MTLQQFQRYANRVAEQHKGFCGSDHYGQLLVCRRGFQQKDDTWIHKSAFVSWNPSKECVHGHFRISSGPKLNTVDRLLSQYRLEGIKALLEWEEWSGVSLLELEDLLE